MGFCYGGGKAIRYTTQVGAAIDYRTVPGRFPNPVAELECGTYYITYYA